MLKYYGLEGSKTQAGCPHENGDAEQRHYRLQVALDQSLMLRGSRDFESREAYRRFLEELFDQLNCGRRERFAEELGVLRPLPVRKLEDKRKLDARVRRSSTIRVLCNVYSVPSRLIGEKVTVWVCMDSLDVWYGQRWVERLPRLRGHGKHHIQYRHVIDSLVRKPGAFANYRYRSDLYPTSLFRIAYDLLQEQHPARADKEYLGILYLAARETESGVNRALEVLINGGQEISVDRVKELVCSGAKPEEVRDPEIDAVNVEVYDDLLEHGEVA